MEIRLRAALLAWLRSDPALAALLNTIGEEAPSRTSAPWLGLVATASTDWSTKDRAGREVRVAFEIHARGDDPATAADIAEAVEARVAALPRAQAGWHVATATLLRARAEQRPSNLRAMLLEYRFRLLASPLSGELP